MKTAALSIVTGNRLSDGRVIYVGPDSAVVEDLASAAVFQPDAAEAALAAATARPAVFVGPYLVEVARDPACGHAPSGRDRLKETIRSAGPTVGNSLSHETA